jgi:hypothetical protein
VLDGRPEGLRYVVSRDVAQPFRAATCRMAGLKACATT